MQNNIEKALRSAKQIEVPSSTFDNVDNVLRNLEQRKDITYMKPGFRKPTLIAAVIAISLLAFSTAALAYTGVLSGFFTAITSSTGIEGDGDYGFGTDARKEIVEQGHVTEIAPLVSITDDGKMLKLNAYYADAGEMWFNLNLSNAELPDSWDQVLPCLFSLEMIYSDGTVEKWEFIGNENSERVAFPGGYFFFDRSLDVNESEISEDSKPFTHNTMASFTDDGSLEITLIVQFSNANMQLGEKVHLQLGNLMFTKIDKDLFIEGADNTGAIQRTTLNGVWEFVIDTNN